MKVCFLTSNHPPEAWGGTEQVVAALEGEYQKQGVEIFVVTSSDLPHAGTDVRLEDHAGVAVHRVFKLADEWDHQGFVRPRILSIVNDLFVRERPDVVHVHSTASLGTGCATIARELGIPVVMTFHDLWSTCARYFRLPMPGITCPTGTDRQVCVACVDQELQAGPEHIAQALAERDHAIRADVAQASCCTAPSATTARFVRECLPYDGEIQVIPHGLLRAVASRKRAAPWQPGENVRVGTFGGLGPEKGIVELIEALMGLGCELHLAGRHLGDEALDPLKRLRESGSALVIHSDYTPTDRHPARQLHLAVFPSKCQETYGLVVDEALAHGVPCVVSDNGALRERDGDPGVIVTPLDRLPRILHDLVTDPGRLAALRRAVPVQQPSIADAAARYLEIYRQIA